MTLTLSNLPRELDEALQRRAQSEGKTVDQVALEVIRAGLGMAPVVAGRRRDLSEFAGSWASDGDPDAGSWDREQFTERVVGTDQSVGRHAHSGTAWPALFTDAFASIGPRLERVIDLASCRELWLQAELCLYLRDRGTDISVNQLAIGGGRKVDFSAELPTRMAAELKILGNGYSLKCFDGNARVSRFHPKEPEGRVRITDEDFASASGYFLHDCARLRQLSGKFERFMLLVIDRRGRQDSLGRALLAAQVSGEEWTWEPVSRSFVVRIWRLSPPVAGDDL